MALARFSVKAAADKGATYTLRDPADIALDLKEDGENITIDILGRDSDQVKVITREIEHRIAEGEAIDDEMRGRILLAGLITGWSSNLCIREKGDLPFSRENALRLLTDPDTSWVSDQLGPFSLRRANYVKNRPEIASSKNSSSEQE